MFKFVNWKPPFSEILKIFLFKSYAEKDGCASSQDLRGFKSRWGKPSQTGTDLEFECTNTHMFT